SAPIFGTQFAIKPVPFTRTEFFASAVMISGARMLTGNFLPSRRNRSQPRRGFALKAPDLNLGNAALRPTLWRPPCFRSPAGQRRPALRPGRIRVGDPWLLVAL